MCSLNVKTVVFKIIQFSISTQFISIRPIDRTLSDVTTLDQSGPGSDGYEGVLCIPQSSGVTGAPPSDCLVYIKDTRWGGGIFLLCRGADGVFYRPSLLSKCYEYFEYLLLFKRSPN